MCVRALNACSFVFDSVPKRYKTQEVCGKAVDNYSHALNLFLIDKKLRKYVRKLFMIIFLQYNFFLQQRNLCLKL